MAGKIFWVGREKEAHADTDYEDYQVFDKEPKFKKQPNNRQFTQASFAHFVESFCVDMWENTTGVVIPVGKIVRIRMTIMKGLK